jgi:PII-like signaling protein
MGNLTKAKLLRIFLGDSDKIGGLPVYEKIIRDARKMNLSGATAFKGFMGFGRNSKIHTSKILAISDDLPVVVEIVDSIEKIEEFLPFLEKIFEEADCGGLITIEEATILKHAKSVRKKGN